MKTKLLAYSIYLLTRILGKTYRFDRVNQEVILKIRKDNPTPHYVYGLWHQNLLSAIFSEKGNPHAVVVSGSKDGELVAVTCELLGNKAARGSSHRGGVEALKSMLRLLREGFPGAITVDGPKGPMYEPKKGIFEIAKLASIPVLPFCIHPEKFWEIKNSWDQFRIPKPFSKIYIFYGDPIYVDKKISSEILDQYCSVLKSQLLEGEKKLIDLIRQKL